MERANIQKELFELEAPKREPRRFASFLQRPDFAVSLTAEKLIIFSIAIIMLLVVSFALGVERGKSISAQPPEEAPIAVRPVARQATLKSPVAQSAPARPAAPATNITVKEKAPARARSAADKGMPFMIAAAAFYKEATALKEVARLRKNGFDAYVYFGDPYYLACVGSFASRDSASAALAKVRRMYKDAYIRLK